MIRLNLLHDQFGQAPAPTRPAVSDAGGSSLEIEQFTKGGGGGGKKVLFALLGVVVLAALGGGVWFFALRPSGEAEAEAPANVPSLPEAVPAPATQDSALPPAVDSAALTAQADSAASGKAKAEDEAKAAQARAEDSAKAAREAKAAQLRAQEEVLAASRKASREQAPAPAATPVEPERVAVRPAVVAPPLAGGVLDLVLGQSRSASGGSKAATSFEQLAPTARLAYQRFAFQRLLSILRQVTPADGLTYSRIQILSPGLVVASGKAEAGSFTQLVQGLLAQSLVDTATTTTADGGFAVSARLPFSVSAGVETAGSSDFAATGLQVLDLASAQSLVFAKPGAPRTTSIGSLRRASWTFKGLGGWEAVDRWIGALQSARSPAGFTSLVLTSGADGKLKVEASVISYGK